MTYRQDTIARNCSICKKTILQMEWMLDLFRAAEGRIIEWVHEDCARSAIETWIRKKEERANEASIEAVRTRVVTDVPVSTEGFTTNISEPARKAGTTKTKNKT